MTETGAEFAKPEFRACSRFLESTILNYFVERHKSEKELTMSEGLSRISVICYPFASFVLLTTALIYALNPIGSNNLITIKVIKESSYKRD